MEIKNLIQTMRVHNHLNQINKRKKQIVLKQFKVNTKLIQ